MRQGYWYFIRSKRLVSVVDFESRILYGNMGGAGVTVLDMVNMAVPLFSLLMIDVKGMY